MKRLLVAFILVLNMSAYAETPASVRIRVKLPFDSSSPSAVVLPVGTLVTVLWPQDDKLMVRYRRVEGLVPAVTIDYVPGAHPADVRQFRPEPAPRESDNAGSRTERTANTYHAEPNPVAAGGETANGSLSLYKLLGGAILVVMVIIFASGDRRSKEEEGPQLRRRA